VQEAVLSPPYEIGGKPNAEKQGGDLSGLNTPLSRYASLPPCSTGGTNTTKHFT
jgi:hypothetical protein